MPVSPSTGRVWHAVCTNGRWSLETKITPKVYTSRHLILMFEVGQIRAHEFGRFRDVVETVPADGQTSRCTGRRFTCRIWAMDALYALEDSGLVRLPKSVAAIEDDATDAANEREDYLEGRFLTNRAVVLHPYS